MLRRRQLRLFALDTGDCGRQRVGAGNTSTNYRQICTRTLVRLRRRSHLGRREVCGLTWTGGRLRLLRLRTCIVATFAFLAQVGSGVCRGKSCLWCGVLWRLAWKRGGCGCLLERAGAAALCLEDGSCGCLLLTPAAAAASVFEPELLPPSIAKFVDHPLFVLVGGGGLWV